MPLFYFLQSPAVNLRTQSAPSFTAPSSVEEISPFVLEVAPHLSSAVHWKSLLGLAWLSCAGLDLRLAAESRAKGFAPVSSSLRTGQERFALIFLFHSHLTADFSIPITTGDISNRETSRRSPPLHPQPLLSSVVSNFWWKRSGSASGRDGYISWFSLLFLVLAPH